MKIIKLSIDALEIPFIERFRHSLKDRTFSDSVIVRVETDTGHVGYGEGVPRPYVTGETVHSVVQHITGVLWPQISNEMIHSRSIVELLMRLVPLSNLGENHNAARCAVETALIDASLKGDAIGLHDILPARLPFVTYSGVITAGSPKSVYKRASQLKRIALNHVKIKVGVHNAIECVAAAREALGEQVVIRVDANSSWSLKEAIEILHALNRYRVSSCEEPLPAREWKQLAMLRQATSIPLMADESLLSIEDAQSMVDHQAIDLFNIRLSKCGGIGPSLRIIDFARKNNIGYQIGAHVGETAILSSIGRHFAAYVGDAQFVEGSYGTLLLTEDIARTSPRFGHKGVGRLIKGHGIGVKILEERIIKYSVLHLDLMP
ncbi:MAG: enolase [Deltaproteobacteria bacterium]|nr:enolase [Deltaproteobacteria bacterium]